MKTSKGKFIASSADDSVGAGSIVVILAKDVIEILDADPEDEDDPGLRIRFRSRSSDDKGNNPKVEEEEEELDCYDIVYVNERGRVFEDREEVMNLSNV